MKAYSLFAINDLRYTDIEHPRCPSMEWCVVKVKAAGVCSSDIPRIYKKGTYHFPTIPGHEFSGIVEEVIDRTKEDLIGKRVSVFPLIPCKKCHSCSHGQYEMCNQYDYLGSRRDGAFAEYVTVPIWNLVEISENISFIEGAMFEPLAVSLHAIKKTDVKNMDVAIIGSGMIAFAAAQWAVLYGAKCVTILGRSYEKKKLADSFPMINYQLVDDCRQEFDVVFEAVGGIETINKAIILGKAGGKIVLLGNPVGDIIFSQNVYWSILRKQLCVLGTWNSSYENNKTCDWTEVRDRIGDHSINILPLVSHVYPQERLIDALTLMRDHKESFCKVMTTWNKE